MFIYFNKNLEFYTTNNFSLLQIASFYDITLLCVADFHFGWKILTTLRQTKVNPTMTHPSFEFIFIYLFYSRVIEDCVAIVRKCSMVAIRLMSS
jgi:hypothetical protein